MLMRKAARSAGAPRQRKSDMVTFASPVAGWIANRALAEPNSGPQGAVVLENFFPTATGAILRRGSYVYAQVSGEKPVTALFKYVVGNNQRLFVADATTVYDITTIIDQRNWTLGTTDYTLGDPGADYEIGVVSVYQKGVWENTLGGDWFTVQFATTGGVFLIGVNGASKGFIFDGTKFYSLDGGDDPAFPGVKFPNGLTTADMAYVWVYKNSLWFVEKESLNAYYLPVDQIGGTAKIFPLGSEFGQGGSVLIGQSWSLNTGGQGGLSDQCVFVSTEGEVVVYQGSSPDQAASWSKVGTYRIGAPMGRRGFIRAGGDLVFATTIGFVALSTAVQVDMAALSPRAVSYAIEDKWNDLVAQRGRQNWVAILWPEGQMVAVAPPTADNVPMFLVSNARTGAWANFTNWNVTCMEVFRGRLFFGRPDGYIMEAMVGGTDDGTLFTGAYMPLFTDAGKPTLQKVARMARAELVSDVAISEKVSCLFDFTSDLPEPPNAEPTPVGNEWDNAVWDQSVWGWDKPGIISKRRHSVSGNGYRLAPVLQITSGSVVPLDARIVTLDVTYEYGDIFT
jgi:hypothetical protein